MNFVLGIETAIEFAENLPTAFDVEMVIAQIEDCGKYKGILHCEDDHCENYIPVSVAKQIIRGRGLGGILGYKNEE